MAIIKRYCLVSFVFYVSEVTTEFLVLDPKHHIRPATFVHFVILFCRFSIVGILVCVHSVCLVRNLT